MKLRVVLERLSEKGIRHAFLYVIRRVVERFCGFVYDRYKIGRSKIRNKPLVHVVGDSHVEAFRWNRSFIAHQIGPATAHNLKKKESSTNSNKNLFRIIDKIAKKDLVMLVFGEIDCRIHVFKRYKDTNMSCSINDILDLTIANYGEVLQRIREMNRVVCVYSVPPVTTVGNQYKYPFYGTPEVRREITRLFNEKLANYCEQTEYVYINVYSSVSDGSGMMLPEYAADDIHLNSKVVSIAKVEIEKKLGISLEN
ncbi:MAG: SGNH/GDSL hydrolase family protein [bacterium]|nr:SGNH/GDSL hydrolase family protein [bacterium]